MMATQMPLPDTQEDLWRLLYDRSSKTVIMLNELDTADKVSARSRSNRQFCIHALLVFIRYMFASMCNVPLCNFAMQTCQAYWPEKVGVARKFGDLEVTLKLEEMSSLVKGLTIRDLTLTNTAKVTKLKYKHILFRWLLILASTCTCTYSVHVPLGV